MEFFPSEWMWLASRYSMNRSLWTFAKLLPSHSHISFPRKSHTGGVGSQITWTECDHRSPVCRVLLAIHSHPQILFISADSVLPWCRIRKRGLANISWVYYLLLITKSISWYKYFTRKSSVINQNIFLARTHCSVQSYLWFMVHLNQNMLFLRIMILIYMKILPLKEIIITILIFKSFGM